MNPDLMRILKNRWFQIGAAGAAGLGLVVFIRSRNAGGDPASDGAAAASGGYVGAPGLANTTGSDVAAALGGYQAGLVGALNDYQKQLTDALEQIRQIPTEQPTGSVPRTPPPPAYVVAPVPKTVIVKKYTKSNTPWESTLSGIAAHYNTTVARLQALNPSITNPNLIHPGQSIQVG